MTDWTGAAFSRRTFLATGFIAGAATALPACAAPKKGFFERYKVPLGVQLFPVSADVRNDAHATFARLAKMGYQVIETAGLQGLTPVQFKAAADQAGLAIGGAHISAQLRGGGTDRVLIDDLAPLIDDLNALTVRDVVMALPLLPDDRVPAVDAHVLEKILAILNTYTVSDWQRTAAFLNERGERFRHAGMRLSYHNHNMDFRPIGDTTGWDVLMRETDPALVSFEMDVGWVIAAGLDPLQMLRRYPGRIRMLHVKDVDHTNKPNFKGEMIPATLGQGQVDWGPFLHAARDAGVTGYFVEQEAPFKTTALDAMAESIAYLRQLA